MKKLIIAAALATVLISPALAQSYDPDLGSGNVTRPFYAHARDGAFHTFARVNPHLVGRRHASHRAAHAR